MKFFTYLCCSCIFLVISCKDDLITVEEYYDGILYKSFTINQDSMIHGTLTTYHEDGKTPFEKATYLNGKLEGKRTLFFENGQVEILETYKNDLLDDTLFVYFENGNINQKVPYVQGVLEGVVKSYYASGKLKEKVMFQNNEENGDFEEYHENGNLKWKGTFLNGANEFGELFKYDSSGTLIRRLSCDSTARCTTIWTIDSSRPTSQK